MLNSPYYIIAFKAPENPLKVEHITIIKMLYLMLTHSTCEIKCSRGWHSDMSCTLIFILGQSVDLHNICFDS